MKYEVSFTGKTTVEAKDFSSARRLVQEQKNIVAEGGVSTEGRMELLLKNLEVNFFGFLHTLLWVAGLTAFYRILQELNSIDGDLRLLYLIALLGVFMMFPMSMKWTSRFKRLGDTGGS